VIVQQLSAIDRIDALEDLLPSLEKGEESNEEIIT
jgi:hypothetical protein